MLSRHGWPDSTETYLTALKLMGIPLFTLVFSHLKFAHEWCVTSSLTTRELPLTHSLQPVGDLLATKISGGRSEVAGWLQGGRQLVADRLQKVAGTIWSQGGFGCCKWNIFATKSIVERCLVATDRSPTGRRLVNDWSPTGCSGCRQSRHSF